MQSEKVKCNEAAHPPTRSEPPICTPACEMMNAGNLFLFLRGTQVDFEISAIRLRDQF